MATVRHNIDADEANKFRNALNRLRNFTYREDEQTKATASLLLDECIAVDMSGYSFYTEFEGSDFLGHMSRQIPLHNDQLMAKLCHVIVNFCVHKNIALATPDLQAILQFLTDGLQRCPEYLHTDFLSALCAVCEGNAHRVKKFHDTLLGGQGILLQLTDDTTREGEVVVEAVRCLASFCNIKLSNAEHIEVRYLSASFDTMVHLLHRTSHLTKMSAALKNKLLRYCFSGIQNIMLLKKLPNIELGTLFAAVRAYMFYGLTSSSLNQSINIPTQLYPNVVAPFDPLASAKTPSKKLAKENEDGGGDGKEDEAASKTRKKNKRVKKKKNKDEDEGEEGSSAYSDVKGTNCPQAQPFSEERPLPGIEGSGWSEISPAEEALSWEMTYLKLSSSDSEFSDTEGGYQRHQRQEAQRVRQAALNCFLNIVRSIDKKVMFGFWSSFLPDLAVNPSSSPPTQSLFTTILKDPSPKCRMAALASLTSMLESTKNFLSMAEDMSSHQPAFTPFSAVLGAMIKEMHRCLMQALVAENCKAVLTQIIKCLASLVSNVPYHRLHPGLLTRVLKQTRHFYAHKDPNLRTAALTCIGAIVGIKPPLMEVSQLIKPPQPPVGITKSARDGDSSLFRAEDAASLLYPRVLDQFNTYQKAKLPTLVRSSNSLSESSDFPPDYNENKMTDPNSELLQPSLAVITASDKGAGDDDIPKLEDNAPSNASAAISVPASPFKDSASASLPASPFKDHYSGSGDSHIIHNKDRLSSESSELVTPVLGSLSGLDTPVMTDALLQSNARETSWVIKLCMKNVIGQPESPRENAAVKHEPLPIRLEALQVLTNLVKNYFPVIRQSLRLLQSVVQLCFEDANYIIKLHGTKLLDELTQALQRDVSDARLAPTQVVPACQILEFWQFLLKGPLPLLLEDNPDMSPEANNLVRSGACECMANIGDEVFAQLPRPHQMQCVTIVLGLARDEDKLIRASAVRALGIYVMYSTLKDDVAFVMDAVQAIMACVSSPGNTVRFKAAWALANLCDTLVCNKANKIEDFLNDFPDFLLLQLMQQTANSIRDSDKVSCNAARAVGNLLNYLPGPSFSQPDMQEAVGRAVKGLVKNMNSGTMKVRWNSCYAASNAFQNPHLPHHLPWVGDMLHMLCKVVQTCTNFKVRINAALGLAAPPTRRGYGSPDTFASVWLSLVTALETAENINDFAEYKYKDNLTEHIVTASLHVLLLMEPGDVAALAPHVHTKGHTFRSFMEKYNSIAGHKSSSTKVAGGDSVSMVHSAAEGSAKGPRPTPGLAEVLQHLDTLHSTCSTEEQRRCLATLATACDPDSDQQEEKVTTSAFQQTYD